MASGNPAFDRAPVESFALRQTGISGVGDIPWGTHLCQFYEDKQDLLEILVPYIKAGLQNNEFCMWVASQPLSSAQAKAALAACVDNLERYIANGQLEVLEYSEWYNLGAGFQSERVLRGWVDRLETAARRGFDGLRLTGNTSWLEEPDWHGFTEYEATVDAIFGQHRMVGICTYMLSKCSALQIMDVISNHSSALVKRAGKWQVVQSSERKKVEANLHETEERLHMAVASTGLGTWDFDVATGAMICSDLCKRHFGLPPHREVDLNTFLRGIHPDDVEEVNKTLQEVLRSGSDGCFDAEYRTIGREDGKERWIRGMGRAFFDCKGRPVSFLGTTLDITERRLSEAALRRAVEFHAAITNNMGEGVYTMDAKGCVTSMNPVAERLFGWTFEELRGKRIHDLIHYKHRDGTPFPIEQCAGFQVLREGVTLTGHEDCFIRKDGTFFDVIYSSSPLREGGQATGLVVVFRDVTAFKNAQAESIARQKLESLGTLAGGIAHDFNNLLGAMLAQAELATAELATGSPPDEALNQIREAAIRGSEIVRQLMIYAGKEEDVLELTDLSKTVTGMLGLLKVTVSRQATLVTDLDQDLPAVRARPAQLRQIAMNLVVNASDAIKDHEGMIRVTTRRVTVDHDIDGVTSDCLVAGDYVELAVSDTGIGMSSETKARVFDPFFTTKSAGHGMGLAVVHGIVRGLNGEIRVISELKKGTTFQILLPCAAAADGATAETAVEMDDGTSLSREPTVLVVEDENQLRLAVTKMLSKVGFRVLQVDNGSAAIELLRNGAGEIDAILLDMTIPGAPSQEVLDAAAEARPNTRIVLTSAYSEQTARSALSGPQLVGFVRKPFRIDDLVRTLRNALSSNSAA
jgi:PAS domain S-box-containing protein